MKPASLKQILASASFAALAIGTPAIAQDTTGAPVQNIPSTSDPDQGVEDIVVTAQRREERLQDAPLSVTALSAGGLEARGIDNLGDVSNFAPNLELHPTNRPAGGGSAFAGYIRGVGTSSSRPIPASASMSTTSISPARSAVC